MSPEFLQKLSKSSFLRKQESISFKTFWIPVPVPDPDPGFAGMTMEGYFSKVSP
jgi:hypothetical protein